MSSTSPTAHHQQHHSGGPLLAAVAASVVTLGSTPSAPLGMQVGRGAEGGGGGLQPHGAPLSESGMLEDGIPRPAEDGGRAEVEVDRGASQGATEGEVMTTAAAGGPQGGEDEAGEAASAGRGQEGVDEEEEEEELGEEEEEEEEDLTVSEDTTASLMQGGASASMASASAASSQIPTRNKRKNFKPRNIVYEEEEDDEDDDEDDDEREDEEEEGGRGKLNSSGGGHGMPLDLSLMRKMGEEEEEEELEEDEEEFDEEEEEDDDGGGRGSYSSGSGAEGMGGGGLDLSSGRSSSSRRKCLYPPVRMVSGREGSAGTEEGGASSSASSSPAPGVGAPSLSHPPPPSSAAFAAFSQALHRFGFPPHAQHRSGLPRPDSAMKEYAESTMKELLGIYGLGDASDAASRNAAAAAAHGFASGSAQSEGAGCGHGGGPQQQHQLDNIRHKMADSVAKLAGLSPNSIMGNPRVMLQQDMATILTLAALQEQKAAAAAVNMGAEASNGQLSTSPGGTGSPSVGGPQGAGSSVKVPAPPIDYSRYVKRFSSAAECGSYYCRDLNYREHFHCLDCNSRVFVKKEEMIRHFKWHKKRDESLQHGFMRYSPMDDCSDRFRDCSHNRKQTHYHCLKEGCEKVYISTSDVQMHANYHRKDSAIIQEGFQRYRATEDCASPHCSFYGQRTTHFHCRRSNCKFTFKNKADMEKHKTYHIKDEQLNRDGFKKFMKHEHCSFENCRFSRVCNHIHCIRLGCSYVLHSSGQLYSHKRKHERKDNEMAYRKFKLAQSMLKSFGGSGAMDCGGMPGMGQSAATSPHDFSSMDSMFAERVGTPPMGQGGRIQGMTPDTSSSPVAPSAIQTSVIQGPSAHRPPSPQQQLSHSQQSHQPQQSQESQDPGSSPGRSTPDGMPNGLPPGPQGLAAFHKYSSVFGGLECMAPPGLPSPFLIGTPGGAGAGVPVGAVAGYTPPSPHLLSQTPPGCEPLASSSSSSAVDLSHGDFRAGPVTVSAMMHQQQQQQHPSNVAAAAAAAAARHFPLLPDDLWRKYLTCHRAGEKCGGRGAGPNAVCEFLGKEHFHCMAEGCDMTFRSKDGVREHARNHEQQEQVTEAFYWTVEVGQEPCRPCPPDCPFQNKEKHYHCCWENCREIILPTDKPFRRLDHYKMHEYSRKLSLTKDPMTMTLATSIDGMFRRKRGRPPKNRVIEFPMSSTPGTMDVPQAIFASFKLPKPAAISASVAQSHPFGMAPMSQGMRMGPMTGTPNPSPPSSSPPRPAPPLSAPPTGSTISSIEKPSTQVQEGFYVFGDGSPCPDGPLCPFCSRRHFHCTQPRCFYVTDREDILIMHSKDFHDNIDIMEGFVFFDRTIDCRLPSCHSNKVNRHFHCTRPNCGYSFVRYSTMAVHEQKHRDEEEGGGNVAAGADVVEGEEERWEGPGGECTPNGGGAERRVSPAPSTEREDSMPPSKGFALQNPNPAIRLPCTPNQIARPGQLSPSTGTTVVKAAGTFYPLSAFSSGRPHGKAAKHDIQTSPRPSPSPTANPHQPSTSSPTRSSSSAASSSASSSPPPAPHPIPPPAPPLRLAVAAWHSPVAGVGRDGTVMTDGGEGSPDASQSNSLANLLQKVPTESSANQNISLQQQPATAHPDCWMDVERHVRYGPEHSCSRPFCKLKRKEHYHCMACNQAFSELERLRPHIQKHAGGALSPDSSCVPLEASPGPRTKDASVGTVVIKTEQENGGEVDGEDGGGSVEGGSVVETAEGSQRSSPQPTPEEHGPPIWARAGPIVGGDPSYPHHFALANPFALVTSRGMPFVGPGMPAIYSSPTGLMFAPALSSLRPPQGSSPGGGVMGEPGDSSGLQQQHPFNSLHRPSLLGKRSSPTAPLHAPLHHLHLSSPHHQFLPPPPNPPSCHNPPSPLSVALHSEALSPEAKKARIQNSMRILKDEPVPDGYIRFRFNEDCKYPHCGYREHQTHFHCMRPDCGYSFCDKTRFVQHTARHERLDTLMGGDFQQFRANVPCGRPDCAYTSTLGSMQNKASHFHCLKCEFVCTDTNKVVAHRRQHQKLDSIMAAGFEKFTPSQTCQVEGCAHSQKQTHYHCLSCHYAVLGLSQMSAHKYRHLE